MNYKSQSGVALAIVVWFLAAMSLLVAGIVFQAKIDTRMTRNHVAKAKAVAAGDGAIEMMLAVLKSNQLRDYHGRGVVQRSFEIGEQQVSVSLVPVSGLIDINGATGELLAALFAGSSEGGMGDAQFIVENALKWRNRRVAGSKQSTRFSAPEDLLRVEGMSRSLYELIRDAIVVASTAQSGVDWVSAPESVLLALSGNNSEMVSSALAARAGGDNYAALVPRGMNARFQSAGSGNEYRLDALITVGDKQWLRRRWVSTDTKSASGVLPWRFTRTEPVRSVIIRK